MKHLQLVTSAARQDQRTLRVLDLFSGLGGWARPMADRGHRVVTLDNDPRFACDFTRDILSVRSLVELEGAGGRFDLVVASPPCQTFSLLACWRYWEKDGNRYTPRNARARHGRAVMAHTFRLIADYNPRAWVIENPRGLMRKLSPVLPTTTVWYCRLGEMRAKPTDIWTNLQLRWPEACVYRNPDCDHEKVPRGVRAGTIGLKTPAERSLVPYGLGLTVAIEVEHALGRVALDGAGISTPQKAA